MQIRGKTGFLVTCYAILHPALLVHPSVCPSVGPSITLYFLRSMAYLLLPKWSSDHKYSPCPPTRKWGSRVSGRWQKFEKIKMVRALKWVTPWFSEINVLHIDTPKWVEKQKSPCGLQDFVSFWAAALLPLTRIHNHAKQGNGYCPWATSFLFSIIKWSNFRCYFPMLATNRLQMA